MNNNGNYGFWPQGYNGERTAQNGADSGQTGGAQASSSSYHAGAFRNAGPLLHVHQNMINQIAAHRMFLEHLRSIGVTPSNEGRMRFGTLEQPNIPCLAPMAFFAPYGNMSAGPNISGAGFIAGPNMYGAGPTAGPSISGLAPSAGPNIYNVPTAASNTYGVVPTAGPQIMQDGLHHDHKSQGQYDSGIDEGTSPKSRREFDGLDAAQVLYDMKCTKKRDREPCTSGTSSDHTAADSTNNTENTCSDSEALFKRFKPMD